MEHIIAHPPIDSRIEYDNDSRGQWYMVEGIKIWFPYGDNQKYLEARQKAELILDTLVVMKDSNLKPSEIINEMEKTKEALSAAINYIECSPCDPDITKKQQKAWEIYNQKIESLCQNTKPGE